MKFEVHISETDYQRLYAIKKLEGKAELSGNDYAEELLHKAIVRLFPAVPQYDENGKLTNGNEYRGK